MEKNFKAKSGFLWLLIFLLIIVLAILNIIRNDEDIWMIILSVLIGFISFICLFGLFIVSPNESMVMIFFGKYRGTVKKNGFYWANPFFTKKKISLRARNLDSQAIKVNDKLGNPVMISVILVWKVEDTFKAVFDVDNYEHFVGIQSEAATRKLAGLYPYDDIESPGADITLRSGGEEVNHQLEKELQERLEIAGIKVIESRISNLAYAPEIASAMLQRQQATAIVAARFKIVEGAVSMVEMALEQITQKNIARFSEEKKAEMVSNLMVVLCSEKNATPVVELGS
ncbi:MAG: SPFH domain-containing protein [Sphingobacteriales bacterium]|nr:SPFH domain-containing protein [Sphingobacteriales bacterium]